jgi:hypothetical protein
MAIVIERKTRSGRRVYLDRGGVESDPETPWTTVCEDHGGCVSHRTRKLAESWLSHPEDWCPGCKGEDLEDSDQEQEG